MHAVEGLDGDGRPAAHEIGIMTKRREAWESDVGTGNMPQLGVEGNLVVGLTQESLESQLNGPNWTTPAGGALTGGYGKAQEMEPADFQTAILQLASPDAHGDGRPERGSEQGDVCNN